MFTLVRNGRAPSLSLACVAFAVAAAALAGCDPLGEFRQREVTVKFESDTPRSVRMQVRADCAGLPRVTPVPINSDGPEAQRVNSVRYDVDDASATDLARLYKCLTKHPSVVGVSRPN